MAQDPNIFQMQEDELHRLRQRVEGLRRRYEHYFLGMEKTEPGFERERLDRDIRNSKLHHALNAALRFRFKQLTARYRTLAERWDRVTRQIEDGTYNRGAVTQQERLAAQQAEEALRRAEGLDPKTGRPKGADVSPPGDVDADGRRVHDTTQAAQRFLARLLHAGGQATGQPKKTDSRPPTAALSAGVLESDTARRSEKGAGRPLPPPPPRMRGGRQTVGVDSTEALYQAYLSAKVAHGDDVSRVTLERFRRSVEKQKARAEEKLGARVELRVKVGDDKISLVARRKN